MLTLGNFHLFFFFFLNPNLIGVPHGGSPSDQVMNLKHWLPAPKDRGGIFVFRFPRELINPQAIGFLPTLAPPPPPTQARLPFRSFQPLYPFSQAARPFCNIRVPLEFSCKPPAWFANYQSPFISSFIQQSLTESQPVVQPRARHGT